MENPYIDKEKKVAGQESLISKAKWQCMCPKCTNNAINSHLLQRNGILSHVAVDGHLYEVKMEDAFKWHEKEPMRFKKVGILQAISYPLFCKTHDTELFLKIEGGTIDFDDYESQLLFSYRGLCAEIYKKQCNKIRYDIWQENTMKIGSEKGTDIAIKDLSYYKYLLESEIQTPKNKFTFLHFSYPFIGIYACGSISYDPVDYYGEWSIKDAVKKKVLDGVFFNIIPQAESLEIIIGYHNNHQNKDLVQYVNSWAGLTFEQLQIKLTDLFATRLEIWGMSPVLYDQLSDEKKDWLIKQQGNVAMDFFYDIRKEVKYNLFDEVPF